MCKRFCLGDLNTNPYPPLDKNLYLYSDYRAKDVQYS